MVEIEKIVSGGQTGADQAALDFAIENGISHGGWIPKGRLTENGVLADQYLLKEMPSKSYPKRTAKNITDSDGTLIVSHGKKSGGTALTWKLAKQYCKPCLHLDLSKYLLEEASTTLLIWIIVNNIKVLNVAGPRASKDVEIYGAVKNLLNSAEFN